VEPVEDGVKVEIGVGETAGKDDGVGVGVRLSVGVGDVGVGV
jgi:hypothetical protein